MKKYLKSFWNWLKDLTTLDERTAELYGEAKNRAKEVKKEFNDVKKAAKNVVNQSKDVVEAVKGKKKRGRKPNYKTKTNNSKRKKK
jgi:methyl-accepting chemotaxis protein